MTENEVHNIMYKVVEKNVQEPGESGLFLLPGATGSGKTYAVSDFIALHAHRWKSIGAKVYFTTRMLKNLPAAFDEKQAEKQLERAYQDAGKWAVFKDEVVVLRGAYDHLSANWEQLEPDIKGRISGDKKLEKAFAEYAYHVKAFLSEREKNDDEEIFYEKQRFFIAAVRSALEEAFPLSGFDNETEALKARKKALFTRPAWSWIPSLWPDHRVSSATVVLLTLRKFTLPLITVLESAAPVKDSLPKKSLVFIDEFDDAKTAMLDFIIEDCLKHEVDLVELTHKLGTQILESNFLPDHLLKYRLDTSEKKVQWVEKKQAQYEQLKIRYKEISQKYSHQFSLLSHPKDSPVSGRFLTRSFQPLVWSGSACDKVIVTDEDARINWIRNRSNETTENEKPLLLSAYSGDLSQFVESFLDLCNDLILNYKGYLEELRKEGSEAEFVNWNTNAYTSTIIGFFIAKGSSLFEFLYHTLLRRQWVVGKWKFTPDKFDIDQFYTRGFYRISLKDDEYNGSKTSLNMISFSPTPEAWIVSLAKRAFVFGLSATAYIEQPLTNFALDFLRRSLGSSFRSISTVDMEKLTALQASLTAGYNQVEFYPSVVELEEADCPHADDWIERWGLWLNDRSLSEHVYNGIYLRMSEENSSSNDHDYKLNRYDRIFQAMRIMSSRSMPNVLYAVTPNLFRDEPNSVYAREILKDFHDGLQAAYFENPWNLTFINSHEFEKKIEILNASLNDRNRHFVCTSYSSISRGVNLQYSGLKFSESIQVHEFPREGDVEVDIDGIFLDTPTNILSNYNGIYNSQKNMISRLVHLHYLAAGGYVTGREFKVLMQNTSAMKNKGLKGIPLAQSAVDAGVASQVFQALGRITRTGRRFPEITITTQQGLPDLLARVPLPAEIVLTHEYEHIIIGKKPVEKSLRRDEQRIQIFSNHMNRIISTMLRFLAEEKNRIDWQSVRNQALRFPVNPGWKQDDFQCIYCDIPEGYTRFFYRVINDFTDCDVKIQKPSDSGYSEVSQEASGLPALMKISGLKEFFYSHDYAIEWEPSSVILNPVAFNNIYKGALGEVALEFFFKEVFQIQLSPMPDEYFEVFDFIISPGVYVDSKFWSPGPDFDNKAQQEYNLEKLNKIGGTRVFVINTFPATSVPNMCVLSSFPQIVLINALFVQNKIWKTAVKEIGRLL